MFKKILSAVIIVLIFISSGCAKCIKTEYEEVEVVIVDEYYKSAWVQPISTGKGVMIMSHPARYEITVVYNGVEYTLDNRDTYAKYKDKVGQTASATLQIKIFDNNTKNYDIISLN